jgi:hypothetical protein
LSVYGLLATESSLRIVFAHLNSDYLAQKAIESHKFYGSNHMVRSILEMSLTFFLAMSANEKAMQNIWRHNSVEPGGEGREGGAQR